MLPVDAVSGRNHQQAGRAAEHRVHRRKRDSPGGGNSLPGQDGGQLPLDERFYLRTQGLAPLLNLLYLPSQVLGLGKSFLRPVRRPFGSRFVSRFGRRFPGRGLDCLGQPQLVLQLSQALAQGKKLSGLGDPFFPGQPGPARP